MPATTGPEAIDDANSHADAPVSMLALTSDTLPLSKLEDLAQTTLTQKISQLTGVGEVTWTDADAGIILNVHSRPGANAAAVVGSIKALLPQLEASMPPSVKISILVGGTVDAAQPEGTQPAQHRHKNQD